MRELCPAGETIPRARVQGEEETAEDICVKTCGPNFKNCILKVYWQEGEAIGGFNQGQLNNNQPDSTS